MRHFIVPSPISSGPDRMSQASTAAALITSPRLAHTLAAGSTGAVLAAVALSPVAAAADRYLRTAAAAQKEAAREHPRRSFRSAAGGSGKRSTECADNAIMQVAHRQWSVTPSPDLPVEIGVTPDCFCGADLPADLPQGRRWRGTSKAASGRPETCPASIAFSTSHDQHRPAKAAARYSAS